MTLVITHAEVTGAAADSTALVDGPAWDANHTLMGFASPAQGGTGVANNAANTITISGNYAITVTLSADTNITFPIAGTLAVAIPGETTLEEYGGAGDGVTDNVAAITAIHAAGKQTIKLGAGKVYKFASAIPTITYGMSIIGDTMSSSVLDFYQTTGSCLYYTGSAGGGGRLEGFSIRNRGAATLDAAIKLEAQAGGGSPDYCLINNVNITGSTNSDLYQYGILIDGSARTTGTVGIRDITVTNAKTFNTTVNAFETRYGKDIQIGGSFFATGTGGVNSGKITGGSGTESNIVRLDADMGDLALDYCINVLADGVFNAVTTTANTSYFNVFGKAVSATINASSTYGRLSFQQGATITNNSTTTFVMDRSGVSLDASAAINFNAGDVTIQHAANALTVTGASNGFFTEYLIAPSVSDGAALGSASFMWSDGFFASGAALNFNNGDVTLQHAANALTVTGATNGFFSENLIAPSASDGAALGSTSFMWSDLFLASGGIINWNSSDVRIIHATGSLTFNGATNGYTFNSGPAILDITRTVTSAAGAVLDDLNIKAATTTVTGSTQITNSAGFNKASIYRPTITDASAVTIDNAATLYIDNAPLAAGSATITAPWALRTGAGQTLFQTANEVGSFTDPFTTTRYSGATFSRVVTSNAQNTEGVSIFYTHNNSTASKTGLALLTELYVPAANSTNHGTLQTWNAQNVIDGTGTTSAQGALTAATFLRSTGTVTTQTVLNATNTNTGGGTVTTALGINLARPTGATIGLTSTWGNIYGIDILDRNPSGAGTNTLTNPPKAIRIQSQTASGGYALSQEGSGLVRFDSAITALSATAIPAGGTAGSGFKFSSTANFGVFFGSGAPSLSAAKGSLYLRSDGSSTSTRMYVNTDGSTTWTAVTTAA